MKGDLEEQLFQAAALTFEELAFMFTNEVLSAVQRDAPYEASARVRFDGPVNGCLVVRIFGGVLATIAGNMLADAEPLTPSLKEGTLKEIANVICGNLLPSVAGDSAVFDLGPPESSGDPAGSDESAFPLVAGAAERIISLTEMPRVILRCLAGNAGGVGEERSSPGLTPPNRN